MRRRWRCWSGTRCHRGRRGEDVRASVDQDWGLLLQTLLSAADEPIIVGQLKTVEANKAFLEFLPLMRIDVSDCITPQDVRDEGWKQVKFVLPLVIEGNLLDVILLVPADKAAQMLEA